jgi:lipopolysaccharide/colanic/teichoic acid biosynthesis glycosyltransferase
MELDFQTPQRYSATNVLDFPIPSPASRARASDVEATVLSKAELLRLMASSAADPSLAAKSEAPQVVARKRSEILNRAVNVTIAAVALVLLSPILLLIAVAVKLTSRGPILYVQTRVGQDRRRRTTSAVFDRRHADVSGLEFRILKFRSMRTDAETGTGAVWATQDDPRVTPIGRFLRKTRLDEVPQLLNVIRGDMNIVGPRPERPSIFAELRQNIQEYPLRQQARPGITGWAQINRAYDASIDDVRAKVAFDLEYLERQSIVEDLKIMVRTLPVMIFNRGAC